MKYTHILAEFCTRAWAIREETLAAMTDLLRVQVAGVKFSEAEIHERIDASNAANGTHKHLEPQMRMLEIVAFDSDEDAIDAAPQARSAGAKSGGTVALIPIVGIISHRMNMFGSISGPGGTSIQKLTAQFRAAMEDGNCKAIVFDVDSPGGSVEGVMELASEIYQGRKQKKIIAVSNAMTCSAAYWLASAAGEVVCTPSGQCGSIGVYMVHQDESAALDREGIKVTVIKAGKYKAEGDPSQPLSDEARDGFQSKVDAYYGMFTKAVAQNRGTSQTKVREGYGEGRSLLAADAVKAGLADRVGTLDDVLGKLGVKSGASSSQFAASEPSTTSHQPSAKQNPDDPDSPDDDDDDNYCGCNCKACEGCAGGCGGGSSCARACDACQSCSYAQAQSSTPALTAEEEKKAAAAAAGSALNAIHARRQREIDLASL